MAKCRPNDKDAKLKFTECSKIVKMRAFERAIAVDKPEKTLSEMFRELEDISKYSCHPNEILCIINSTFISWLSNRR